MRSVCLTSKDGLGRLDRLVINGAQDAEFHSDKFAVPAVPAVLGNMYLDMYHGRWDGGGCAVLCVVTSLRTTRQPDLMLVSRPLRPLILDDHQLLFEKLGSLVRRTMQ